MAELADALDLGSSAARHKGSSPLEGAIIVNDSRYNKVSTFFILIEYKFHRIIKI